jgi:hypothetical protein
MRSKKKKKLNDATDLLQHFLHIAVVLFDDNTPHTDADTDDQYNICDGNANIANYIPRRMVNCWVATHFTHQNDI